MAREVVLESWSEFDKSLQKLLYEQREAGAYQAIFRGQSDALWHLETTLERSVGSNIDISRYYSLIRGIIPEIETFTEKKWDLPNEEDYTENFAHSIYTYTAFNASSRDYMIYLRHYGFPSPLLDWSRSPYVAAYFAFRDIAHDADSVAVYQYWQSVDSFDYSAGKSMISILGGDSHSDKRHYLQQSVYTVCTRRGEKGDKFVSHEGLHSGEDGQDQRGYLTKFILPTRERANALLSLEAHNINAYSLIGSEESLLETIFTRYYAKVKAWREGYSDWDDNDMLR